MGTANIVFFVLADVAPTGVVVALLTLSIALGNGADVPGTYAVADLRSWVSPRTTCLMPSAGSRLLTASAST